MSRRAACNKIRLMAAFHRDTIVHAPSTLWGSRMTLARLRWLTVVAPALFITVFETVRHILFDEVLHLWAGSILVLLVISAGSLVFSRIIFGVIEGMQDEIVRRNQELAARNALGEAVSKALHLDDALGLALEAVLEITRAEAGEILVHEEESGELVMRAHRGVAAEAFREITRFKPETGLPGLVARTGEPVLVQDLPEDPRFLRKKVTLYGFRAFAGVPLRSKNQVVGVMNIASLDPRRITNESLDLLAAIGNQIGVAIENARLMEQMRHLAVLEERDRIGREIHDSFAQTLGYLSMQSRAIEIMLTKGKYDEAKAELGQMGEGVRGAFSDVREAIFNLRTTLTEDRDLAAVLQDYCQEFSRSCGILVELAIPPSQELQLPIGVQFQLMRIVQEAMANARKHAGASRISVHMTKEDGNLALSVVDDGQGFEVEALGGAASRRFGLSIMRERAEAVGARFAIYSGPGQGTRVLVELANGKAGQRWTP